MAVLGEARIKAAWKWGSKCNRYGYVVQAMKRHVKPSRVEMISTKEKAFYRGYYFE